MRLRFHPLFSLLCRPEFLPDAQGYEGAELLPSAGCEALMKRYALRIRKLPSGIELYYQTQPHDLSLVPLRPVSQEENFRFFLKVTDPSFSTRADLPHWHADRIYLLDNHHYQVPGEQDVVNGPLPNPVNFRPMRWKHPVLLRATLSLLLVRNASGTVVLSLAVRALDEEEAPDTRGEISIDLSRFGEGLFTLEQVYPGAPSAETFFCSPDYEAGMLAMVNIRYRYGAAWTGVAPGLAYLLKIPAKPDEWIPRPDVLLSNHYPFPEAARKGEELSYPERETMTFAMDFALGNVTFTSDSFFAFPPVAAPLNGGTT